VRPIAPPWRPGWRVSRSSAAPCARAARPACGTSARTAPGRRRCCAIPATVLGVAGSRSPAEWAEQRKLKAQRASGVAAQPARKRLARSALHPWQESGLAKIRGFGEARCRQTSELPGNRTMQDPPLRRVLLFQGLGVSASRKRDARTENSARTASVARYPDACKSHSRRFRVSMIISQARCNRQVRSSCSCQKNRSAESADLDSGDNAAL
jgi:hypothetical protein